MRRFSQRNALVTLSDINITPLLDLAFVLLIIFIIATPLLEQGMNLKLPVGGRPDPKLDRRDIRVVEVNARGNYMLERRTLPLDRLVAELVREHQTNPNLVVMLRGDRNATWDKVATLFDQLSRNGISRVNPRMAPQETR